MRYFFLLLNLLFFIKVIYANEPVNNNALRAQPFNYPNRINKPTIANLEEERLKLIDPNNSLPSKRINATYNDDLLHKHNFYINNSISLGLNNVVEVTLLDTTVTFNQPMVNFIVAGYNFAVTNNFKIGIEIDYALYGMGTKQTKNNIVMTNNSNYAAYIKTIYTIYNSPKWVIDIEPKIGFRYTSNTVGYNTTKDVEITIERFFSNISVYDKDDATSRNYLFGKDFEEACVLDKIASTNSSAQSLSKDNVYIFEYLQWSQQETGTSPKLSYEIKDGKEYIGYENTFYPVCYGYWIPKAEYRDHVLKEKIDLLSTVVAYGLNLSFNYLYSTSSNIYFSLNYNGTLPGKTLRQHLGTSKQYEDLKDKYGLNNSNGEEVSDYINLINYTLKPKASHTLSIGIGFNKRF